MAYCVKSKKSGKNYFLHGRKQKLKGGQEVTLYYFAGDQREGCLDDLPCGYVVSENSTTGLPLLKKSGTEKPSADKKKPLSKKK